MAKRPPNALWDTLERASKLTDAVLVAFSCGKDSLALLEACAGYFARLEPYYCYVTPGLSFHEATIRRAEKRYGVTIHRLPHVILSQLLHGAVFRVPNRKTVETPILKPVDIEFEIRRRTGLEWIAAGMKRADSLERCGMLSACDGIDPKGKRLYPLQHWRDPFLLRYLKQKRIPLSAEHGVLGHSYGGDLEAEHLIAIRDRFPADYQRIIERFPFACGEVFRHERFGSDSRHIPAVTQSRFRSERSGSPPEQVSEITQGMGASQADETASGQPPLH